MFKRDEIEKFVAKVEERFSKENKPLLQIIEEEKSLSEDKNESD